MQLVGDIEADDIPRHMRCEMGHYKEFLQVEFRYLTAQERQSVRDGWRSEDGPQDCLGGRRLECELARRLVLQRLHSPDELHTKLEALLFGINVSK
jgi:hypothetical protein